MPIPSIPSWVYSQFGLPVPDAVSGADLVDPAALGATESNLASQAPATQDPQAQVISDAPVITVDPDKEVAPAAPAVNDLVGASVIGPTPTAGAVTPDAVSGAAPIASPTPGQQALVGRPPVPPPSEPATPPTDEQRTASLSANIDEGMRQASSIPDGTKQLGPDEIAFRGQVMGDQALRLRLAKASSDAMVQVEEARRQAPDLQRYQADVERITREKDAEVQRMVSEVKRGYDDARKAALEADAAFPNPDDLMGGRGSWSRALSIGITAAFAGVPGTSIASVLDQQLRLQQASQNARYDRLRARAGALADIASRQADSIKDVAGGYDARTNAAQMRLAAGLQVIANGLADPKARAGLMEARAALLEKVSKDQYDQGKSLAEIRLKEVETSKKISTGVAKPKDRPILLPKAAWAEKNGLKGAWGPDAERAYNEYSANMLRQQSEWERLSAHPATSSTAAASGPSRVSGGVPKAQDSGTKTTNMPPAQTASASGRDSVRYSSTEHWFEQNRPNMPRDEFGKFWFVDGKNGSEVPPIEFVDKKESSDFRKSMETARKYYSGLDRLTILTENLRRKGILDKAIARASSALQDEDYQEAEALATQLALWKKEIENLGVLSGNDWEVVTKATGLGDVTSLLKNGLPAMRESLRLTQSAVNTAWETNIPAANSDPRYNAYRVLKGIPNDERTKIMNRGRNRAVGAHEGSADPRSLTARTVKADAPSESEAKANEKAQGQIDEGERILIQAKGKDLKTFDFDQYQVFEDDYPFKGVPVAAEPFREMRLLYVNGAANIRNFLQNNRNMADYRAYKQSTDMMIDYKGQPGPLIRYIESVEDPNSNLPPKWVQDQFPGLDWQEYRKKGNLRQLINKWRNGGGDLWKATSAIMRNGG